MNSVSPVSASVGSERELKMVRAARQFESVLLNTLLGSLEQTFSAIGGKKAIDGSSHYDYLAVQTLASSLANRGGIGIADRILSAFHRREGKGSSAEDKKASQEVHL